MSLNVAVMASNPELAEKLARLLDAVGHRVAARAVVPTRTPDLTAQLKTWIDDPAIQLVIGPAGGTLRRALLPLITKRLIGFTELREIDGGRCQNTIVVMVPEEISFETLEKIEACVMRDVAAQRAETAPPRRTPTTPPPFPAARPRGKTTPPPVPAQPRQPQTTAEFVVAHSRPSEASFDETVSQIKPVRLEHLPLVVSPTPQPPPTNHRRRFWVTIGLAVLAGGLTGRVLACRDRSNSTAASHTEKSIDR